MRGLAEVVLAEPASTGPFGLRRPSVVLLHRIRGRGDALFAPEFADLARRGDLRVWPLTGPRSTGSRWWGGPRPVNPAVELTVVTGGPASGSAAGTGQGPDPAITDPATTGAAAPTPAAGAASSQAAAQSTSQSPSAAAPVTVNGAHEMTRYGVIQVQVVIAGGKPTDVTALQYPSQSARTSRSMTGRCRC